MFTSGNIIIVFTISLFFVLTYPFVIFFYIRENGLDVFSCLCFLSYICLLFDFGSQLRRLFDLYKGF